MATPQADGNTIPLPFDDFHQQQSTPVFPRQQLPLQGLKFSVLLRIRRIITVKPPSGPAFRKCGEPRNDCGAFIGCAASDYNDGRVYDIIDRDLMQRVVKGVKE